jgi:beta-glucuronidase
LREIGFVRGMTPWVLYDFRSLRRQNSHQRGHNIKGLIARDKRTKKRAFATLQAFYRREKTVG